MDEAKAFLMDKCTLVKKKKFIYCANDKKWSLLLLIALIVVTIIGMKVAYELMLNDLYYQLIYMN